jgi:hypothetical protein
VKTANVVLFNHARIGKAWNEMRAALPGMSVSSSGDLVEVQVNWAFGVWRMVWYGMVQEGEEEGWVGSANKKMEVCEREKFLGLVNFYGGVRLAKSGHHTLGHVKHPKVERTAQNLPGIQ